MLIFIVEYKNCCFARVCFEIEVLVSETLNWETTIRRIKYNYNTINVDELNFHCARFVIISKQFYSSDFGHLKEKSKTYMKCQPVNTFQIIVIRIEQTSNERYSNEAHASISPSHVHRRKANLGTDQKLTV